MAPKKAIKEDDDDSAHKDEEAPKIIHFLNATQGHDFLVDAILKQDQGLTFEVFKDDEPVAEEEPAEVKEVAEVLPKFVYVPEVVREPRMHFYKVPKLGAYIAIRLEYESCLYEEALDIAVQDYLEVQARKREQEEEKKMYYE